MSLINNATVIYSQEKSTGKIFYLLSGIMLTVCLITLISAWLKDELLKPFFFTLPFIAIALLFFAIGKFQHRKYMMLGETPLTLSPITKNTKNKLTGTVLINWPNFKRVSQLRLSSMVTTHSQGSGSSSSVSELWHSLVDVDIKDQSEQTLMHFCFDIPREEIIRTHDPLSNHRFHWQISFQYVDRMENISRTWKLPEGALVAS